MFVFHGSPTAGAAHRGFNGDPHYSRAQQRCRTTEERNRRWPLPLVICRCGKVRRLSRCDTSESSPWRTKDHVFRRSPVSARWPGTYGTVGSIGVRLPSPDRDRFSAVELASPAATPWGRSGWWARTPRSRSSDPWRADTRRSGNGDIDVEVDIDDIWYINRQPGIDVHDRRWRIFTYNPIEVPVHARRARRRWWRLGAADRW